MKTQKEYALRSLGAVTKNNLAYLSANVEHVVVGPGRPLRTRNQITRAALVGIRGTITVTDEQRNTIRVDAPYVIDRWIADDQMLTLMDVESTSEGELIIVDLRARDSVFALLPKTERLSRRTLALVREAREARPIDTRVVSASAANRDRLERTSHVSH